jgi:hypothetical protein
LHARAELQVPQVLDFQHCFASEKAVILARRSETNLVNAQTAAFGAFWGRASIPPARYVALA